VKRGVSTAELQRRTVIERVACLALAPALVGVIVIFASSLCGPTLNRAGLIVIVRRPLRALLLVIDFSLRLSK